MTDDGTTTGPDPGDRDGRDDPAARIADEIAGPTRIEIDPERTAAGLAQLVLTVVELLRELMERQAVARLEGGTLEPEQIEALGKALQGLDENMDTLVEAFGLTRDDLNLDLGPLGKLL